MAELQAKLRKRREITEGRAGPGYVGSPQKSIIARAVSIPHTPENGYAQAEGWAAFLPHQTGKRRTPTGSSGKLSACMFDGTPAGSSGKLFACMFDGDCEPPISPTLGLLSGRLPLSPTFSVGNEQDSVEFNGTGCEESPICTVKTTKSCHFWSNRPKQQCQVHTPFAVHTQHTALVPVQRAMDLIPLKEQKDSAARLNAEESLSMELSRELQECREDKARLSDHVLEMQEEQAELQAENKRLENELSSRKIHHPFSAPEFVRSRGESESTRESTRAETTHAETDELGSPRPSSTESTLRAVMAKPGATVDELRSAINAVEALVGEARRELAAGQLRERRAAFEGLHAAIDKADEVWLDKAIAEARRTEVDTEDIEKAEAKLLQLRLLTEEERAAKALQELKVKLKPELFLFAKRGAAADPLTRLRAVADLDARLGELDTDVPWQDWVDFQGRTLLKYARELAAPAVEEVLTRRLGGTAVQIAVVPTNVAAGNLETACRVSKPLAKVKNLLEILEEDDDEASAGTSAGCTTPPTGTCSSNVNTPPQSPGREQSALAMGIEAPPTFLSISSGESEGEHAENKKAAFRAVVQDNVQTLGAVLEVVPMEVWRLWENKAGKDLFTLSTERGSTNAYALLAESLGLLRERKRDTFEEREAVWVLIAGEVLARRATVLEDTPEDVEDVLLEYWDGDKPAERVQRCCVLKAY